MEVQESPKLFFQRLRGNRNAFAMLLCEPMWGIPYNLFYPYFSLYMASLGCRADQIGLINTVGLLFQLLFSLVAAPIIDRFGRKKTTLVLDIVSWSVPTLIWAVAQNFWYFLAAAVIQAINRIVFVSWTCLLVEDTDKSLLVTVFSWLTVAGLLAGFFSPIAALFVGGFGLDATMRWLLIFACITMTAMFFIRNHGTKETSVGKMRMERARAERMSSHLLHGLMGTAREIWKTKRLRFLFILMAVYNMALTVRAPFFALLLTETLGMRDVAAGYFATATSVIMLGVFVFVLPRLPRATPKMPLSVGLVLTALGSLVLAPDFGSPALNLVAVIASVVLTSVGMAVAQPFIDGLSHAGMDNDKRSDMTSILFALTLLATAPFGYLGGWLFELNGRLPFMTAGVLFVVCAALMALFYGKDRQAQEG